MCFANGQTNIRYLMDFTFEMIVNGDDFEKVEKRTASLELTIETLDGISWWNEDMLSVRDLLKCESLLLQIDMKVHREDDVTNQKVIDYWNRLAQHQYDDRI